MSDKQKQDSSPVQQGGLNLTQEQLLELLKAAREPYVDPVKVASAKRNQERMREQIKQNTASKKAAEDACTHMREDNTSRIAWATNRIAAKGEFYIKEGFCQACNKHFAPGVEGYDHYVRIPVGRVGIVQ